MQQHPALTPQQEAIREVRARYERGDITFDRFEYGLNALLAAQSPDECRAIIEELPASPLAVFDGLTAAAPAPSAMPAPQPSKAPARRWMVNIIGEFKRIKRPWRLSEHTSVVMGIGELELDMSLASMPQHCVLEVYALIGEATLYVPSEVRVTVNAFSLIGEATALGESNAGIFAHLSEEFPAQGASAATAPHLEIRAFNLIGELTIKQVDAPVITQGNLKGQETPPALPQAQETREKD
ncbi:MAG TPA: LiaF domain-containing protein [Ktedonobacterales bacterium]|nr:LiaF domain-containing protein [Ktedonobacterales bacterium]